MNKKQLLDHLQNAVYCRLGVSQIQGVGVFAIKKIPQGVDPFKDCYENATALSEKEVESLNPEVQKMIRDFCGLENGEFYVPQNGLNKMDISYYLNHSTSPNMHTPDDGGIFIATRDIEKGEELTVDYSTFTELTDGASSPIK